MEIRVKEGKGRKGREIRRREWEGREFKMASTTILNLLLLSIMVT